VGDSIFDFIGNIFSGGGSDNSGSYGYLGDAGSGLYDYFTGGSKPSTPEMVSIDGKTPTTSSGTGGFWSKFANEAITPKNLIGAAAIYSAVGSKTDAAKATLANAQADREFQMQLLDKKFQQEKELLALKGGGGGGGGGAAAQIAAQKALARYQQMVGTKENEAQQYTADSSNLIQALGLLASAGRR
jgi:hypothetical protein